MEKTEPAALPIRAEPGAGRKALFRLAAFYEDPVGSLFLQVLEWFFIFLAFFVIDIVVAYKTGFLITGSVWDLAVYAFLVILIQRLLAISVFNEPDYAIYLARRASLVSEEESSGVGGERPPTVDFRYHMQAMRRVGNWLSGGYVDDLMQLALPKKLWMNKKEAPKSFWAVARAIELGLVEQAARLPAGKRKQPFADYAADLEKAFGQGAFSFTAWQEFLTRWYFKTSPRVRFLAKAHVPRHLLDKIQAHLEPWKVVVGILTAIVALVALILKP